MDLKARKLFNLAVEVTNNATKNFRTNYKSAYHRIRQKLLEKKGYKYIEIDSDKINNWNIMRD